MRSLVSVILWEFSKRGRFLLRFVTRNLLLIRHAFLSSPWEKLRLSIVTVAITVVSVESTEPRMPTCICMSEQCRRLRSAIRKRDDSVMAYLFLRVDYRGIETY